MINNIPSYYDVKIFLEDNILGKYGPKWPIHVFHYDETKWSPDIYEIQDKYKHPIYSPMTILINKKTYEPYSHNKSALK